MPGLHALRHALGYLLGAKDFEPPVNDFNIELGYLYHSPAADAQ